MTTGRAGYRARMGRARRVEVELGDDAPATDAAPAPARDEPRRRPWWLAAVLAVVLVLVGAQVVTDQRERAARAALAAVPGVLSPLDDVVRAAWQVDPGTRPGARVGDVLVAGLVSDDQAVALQGLDVATGAPVWTLEVLAARGDWVPDALADTVPCATVPARPGQVACLVTEGGWGRVDGRWVQTPTATARLLVLDAADGTVRVDREVPPSTQSFTPSGQDVLLVGHEGGTLHVRAQSLAEGTPRWQVTADVADDGPFAEVTATSGLLDAGTLGVVHGRGVTLVATDGEVLRTVVAEPRAALSGVTTTSSAVLAPALRAAVVGDGERTTVVSATAEVVLDGTPVRVVVDDGSVPGLVLTRTPRLEAWDAGDGTRRWGTTVVDAQDVVVLRGRVHVGTSAAVVTYDGATGAELWRTQRPTATGPPQTDGRHLLVLGGRDGRHRAPYDLVALHVTDGTEAWRTPLPAGTSVQGLQGLLVTRPLDPVVPTVAQVLR
ncbi:PQQ-binding-like beta-propeller repeat protein [Cellulomonas phragmiteti]|uniref:Uncharacterized protein n=1 Tax=Cellulomonas phragmiteti TaxID=478780 RepID=A0ABQ4DPA0_9CELL|nr:PQQ-binding-like beta-propeller repeat protein [Cellulomonas phragmiteti]GIG41176.1 hypothetical protein Cph01nite_29380 [Cellulomonas phragmiteti]